MVLDIFKALDQGYGMLVFFTNSNLTETQVRYLALFCFFLVLDGFEWFLDGMSSQKYPVSVGVPQGSILVPALFLVYIKDLPDDLICNVGIYADDTTLYSKCDRASDLWKKQELASEFKSDLPDTEDWDKEWLLDFSAGKSQFNSFDQSNKTGAIDVKMDGSVLEEKPSFKMILFSFSFKLGWSSYIISIGAVIRSMKFLSPEVVRYLYISTIQLCMEYRCHVWASAPSCYLDNLDKLQKQISRTTGPSRVNRHLFSLGSFSLFHMKIIASVTKSSHQDSGLCCLLLPIFFLYVHSPLLLENQKLW